MVQFVFTPWRDRRELVAARDHFYPRGDGKGGDRQRELRHGAVARVSMWMQRGNCPHLVESTALLTAAVLCDEERGGASAYAVRSAYSTAFSRYGGPPVPLLWWRMVRWVTGTGLQGLGWDGARVRSRIVDYCTARRCRGRSLTLARRASRRPSPAPRSPRIPTLNSFRPWTKTPSE